MTAITDITPADEAMLDAFWSTQRPPRKGPAPIIVPMGATTCTITCRACGKRDTIAISWDGLVCCICRADIAGAKQRLIDALAELPAREAAAGEQWVAVQAALDDATANRLSLMLADRDRAEAVWKRLGRREKVKGNDDPVAEERAAHDAYQAVLAKIERTITKYPEMRAIFDAEATYRAAIAGVKAMRATLECGLQELDAVEGAPF